MARGNAARRRRQEAKRNAREPPTPQSVPRLNLPPTMLPVVPLSMLLVRLGRYHEALAILQQDLPPAHFPVVYKSVCTFSAIGAVYTTLGQHDMALHFLRRALAGLETLVGEATPATVEMTRMVASSYAALGDQHESNAFFQLADDRMRLCENYVEGWLLEPGWDTGMRRKVDVNVAGAGIGWWWCVIVVVVCILLFLGIGSQLNTYSTLSLWWRDQMV